MLAEPSWIDISLRLGLAAAAGIIVGHNRESRSQAAGLRTTTLVCVAACLSMVLADLILHQLGPDGGGLVRADVMRLPLGVLTGMGFIGGGAIIRRPDAVVGVATAATLWFMTMVGLVFGAGELMLGSAVTLGGLFLLWALEITDQRIRRRFRANVRVVAEVDGLPESELRDLLVQSRQRIVDWGVTYRDGGRSCEIRAEVEWTGPSRDRAEPPGFLASLAARPAVREVDWSPQAISA